MLCSIFCLKIYINVKIDQFICVPGYDLHISMILHERKRREILEKFRDRQKSLVTRYAMELVSWTRYVEVWTQRRIVL